MAGPPILEEYVLLELMKKAAKNRLFSRDFLKELARMSHPRPLEFQNEEEIIHHLSKNKAETHKSFEHHETIDEIVRKSVEQNTFRAFGHMPKQPSKVFRDWAKAALQNQNNIDELESIGDQTQYDKWLSKFCHSFSEEWQRQMGNTIPFGSRKKLPNLLLKRFVRWEGLSRAQRDNLLKYLHIPLDRYTLMGMRNCVSDITIPKNATMNFVQDEDMYNRIQRAVRDIAHKAEVPAIYFDNLAWDKSHGKL